MENIPEEFSGIFPIGLLKGELSLLEQLHSHVGSTTFLLAWVSEREGSLKAYLSVYTKSTTVEQIEVCVGERKAAFLCNYELFQGKCSPRYLAFIKKREDLQPLFRALDSVNRDPDVEKKRISKEFREAFKEGRIDWKSMPQGPLLEVGELVSKRKHRSRKPYGHPFMMMSRASVEPSQSGGQVEASSSASVSGSEALAAIFQLPSQQDRRSERSEVDGEETDVDRSAHE